MLLIEAWGLALLAVAAVSASMLGYGAAAWWITGGTQAALALGAGLFASASLTLGFVGGYTLGVQSMLVASGLVFVWIWRDRLWCVLSLREVTDKKPPPWKNFNRIDYLWLFFPALYFLARFFACGVPQQHSDPLYYHLAAPKLWAETGRIWLVPEHPSFAQAALWETVYGIPMLWFKTASVDRLVVSQLYGQWMHALWGQVGSVLLAAALLRRLVFGNTATRGAVKYNSRVRQEVGHLRHRGLLVFIAWLCVTQPAFEWLGCLAKNDYLLVFFLLAAALELLNRKYFWAGVLVGFAYSTKVLAAWAGLSLLFLASDRAGRRGWPRYVVGIGLGAALFLLRNWLATGNPLFPNLDDKIGPHWISSWWISHNLSYGGPLRLDPAMLAWFWSKFLEKALPKILMFGGLVAFAVEMATSKGRERASKVFEPACWGRWLLFLGAQVALALLMLRPASDGRYANYVEVFCALFLAAAALRVALGWSMLRKKAWAWAAGILVCSLGLLVNSPLDVVVKIPRQYWFEPAIHYAEQFHAVFDVQQWVRKKVPHDEKILWTAEKQHYYLDRPFETVVEMKKWEEILDGIHTQPELFAKLRALGYRYVHFSPQTGGYPGVLRRYWDKILGMQDQAVFKSSTSLVFDLRQ